MDTKEEAEADINRPNTAIENSDGANTVAMQSKRARRVSFAAEMTSIHFFDRDEEDNATPSVETGDNDSADQPQLHKEFEDEDEDDAMEMRMSFLRPVGSPSPGGSTFGSASSNDEDNFFGPVSANFIRPGRLSDAASEAASDDNHEFTMDSTAFSMHFRSIARSDSGTDLKTPTGGRLLFEEKTPSDVGSSMILTGHNNLIANPSLAVTEQSEKNDTNDMSLVGDNPKNYDYDKLSPGLDALLAESTSNLFSVTVSNDFTAPSEEVLPLTDQKDIPVNGVVSTTSMVVDEANGPRRSDRSPRMPLPSTSGEVSRTGAYQPNWSPYQLSKEIPSVNAVSPVKHHQVLIPTTASPSRHLVMATPLLNQPVSFTESRTHHDSETSIQKSLSKLGLLEKSASAFSAKVDKSTIRSLDFFRSPNFDALLDSNRHVSRFSLLEDSAAKERLIRDNHIIKNTDALMFWTGTPNHLSGENHLEESLNHTTNGKLQNDSPSKVTEYGNSSMHVVLTSNQDALVTETDSLLSKIIGGGKETITPLNVLSSPNITLEEEISVSPGPESNQFEDFLAHDQFKDFPKSDSGGDSTEHMNLVDASPSTPSVSKDAVSVGIKGKLTSPVCEANHHTNLIEIKGTDTREADNYNKMQIEGTLVNITPDMRKTSQTLQSKIQDAGNQIQILKELHRNLMEFPIAGTSGKEFDDDQVPSIRTPTSIQMSSKLENRSTNKRTLDLLLQDTQHRTETALTQRSPKQQKSGISDLDPDQSLYHNQGGSEGTMVTTCERKQWTDIYPKFSEDTNQLIPHSAGALSNSKIDVLEDILVHRQRSKAYEVLCSGFQNATAHHDLQLDRTAEMNSLIYQIMIEKAKLQLKHIRRERLSKKLELVGSRIQESQVLKANIPSHLLKRNIYNLIVDEKLFPANLEIEHQIFPEKLTAMKQELEAIDGKICTLKRTLHANCKIKAEPSSETISLVDEHLMKCAQRRFLHLDMQMWVVHNVSTENSQHDVVLDYLDVMIQSIKVNTGRTPSTSTSFKLNETNIVKNFPDIDACKAFAFVFNSQTTCKYLGAKSLVLETQVTSSLLGTLLDVIEEVQSAQMEFCNLIQSNFSSPSVEQLDLMLCFFNFRTGRKVTLTLDMSCLKFGIYPSDIIPLQLASKTDMQQDPLSEAIIREIRDGVKGVRSGYTRILRLCRCVSQVIQAISS